MVISVGNVFSEVEEAVNVFGNKVGLINLRFIKPLDKKLIDIFQNYKKIIVVEENVISGGAGSGLLEFAAMNNITNFEIFKLIGINDVFVEHGAQKFLRDKYGLSAEKLKKVIEGVLNGRG